MYLLKTIYPLVIASGNIAMGGLLYHALESVLGILLVVIGLLVVLSMIGRAVSEHGPALGKST